MNKKECIDVLVTRLDKEVGTITKTQADAVVNAFFEAVAEGLKTDGIVQFKGFGTFKAKERSAFSGRNPRTGEPIEVAPTKLISLKAASTLKDEVNDVSTSAKKPATKKVSSKKKAATPAKKR